MSLNFILIVGFSLDNWLEETRALSEVCKSWGRQEVGLWSVFIHLWVLCLLCGCAPIVVLGCLTDAVLVCGMR